MTRDWDLWPWIVADGAGALTDLRFRQAIGTLQVAMGLDLVPVMKRVAAAAKAFGIAYRAGKPDPR